MNELIKTNNHPVAKWVRRIESIILIIISLLQYYHTDSFYPLLGLGIIILAGGIRLYFNENTQVSSVLIRHLCAIMFSAMGVFVLAIAALHLA